MKSGHYIEKIYIKLSNYSKVLKKIDGIHNYLALVYIIEFPPGKVTENKFWITTKKLNCRKKSILFRIEDKLQKSESKGQF